MLKNALEGYNCTMFAYGQTGAGKSYSFVGYGVNKGILPIVSTEIFAKVRAEQSDNHVFQIGCSYMEIYGRAPMWQKSCLPPPAERCLVSLCSERGERGEPAWPAPGCRAVGR